MQLPDNPSLWPVPVCSPARKSFRNREERIRGRSEDRYPWVTFGHLQSEITEHSLCIMNDFELKVFQQPGGIDLTAISTK